MHVTHRLRDVNMAVNIMLLSEERDGYDVCE